MRKGRSQRKTRGSLPPLSTRPQALSHADGGGPQVVIGLTAPRSEESSDAELHAEAPQVAPETVRPAFALEVLAEPTLELVRETLALAEEASDEPERVHVDAHETALPTPSEMSIPPMGDLAVEPVAERFFSQGEVIAGALVEEEDDDWDPVASSKAMRKSLPEVVQRRAKLAKYVRWAVGGAAVVCLAALARTTMSHGPKSAPPVAVAAPAVVEAPVVKAAAAAVPTPPAEPAPVAEPVMVADAVPSAAPAAEPVKAVEPAATVAAVVADAPKTEPAKAPEPGDKTALQEKNDARRSLERGKLADAIAAGERSVALDPTDGEAWLLLGASYQEKGKNAEARRCYASCLKEGKRGPLGECRAMVR